MAKKWVHRHQKKRFTEQTCVERAVNGCRNPTGYARDRFNFAFVTARR